MRTLALISEPQIQSNIARAVADVFHTMLNRSVTLVVPESGATPAPASPAAALNGPQVVGSVGFLGQANGIIYLCFDEPSAKLFTGEMLCLDQAEVEELGSDAVKDAVGELTNMVVGSFKNSLCDCGYPCTLTIPSILRGSDLCVEPWPANSVRRHAYHFDTRGRRIVADILMKADDPAP
jgi:chemotaxis protein CheX